MAFKNSDRKSSDINAIDYPLRKVEQASSALKALSQEWDKFRTTSRFGLEVRGSSFERRVSLVAHLDEPDYEDIESRARNILVDARSALDNLTTALVREFAGDLGHPRASFPLVKSASEWPDSGPKMLRGLPADLIERIRLTQPYVARPDGPHHPLIVLSEGANRSKHRAALDIGLAYSYPAGETLMFDFEMEVSKTDQMAIESTFKNTEQAFDHEAGFVEEGSVVLRVLLPHGTTSVRVHDAPGYAHLSLSLRLLPGEPPQPLIPQLENALRFARQTICYVGLGKGSPPDPFAHPSITFAI